MKPIFWETTHTYGKNTPKHDRITNGFYFLLETTLNIPKGLQSTMNTDSTFLYFFLIIIKINVNLN